MNIQLGQYAGFCFGVDRAVSMVEEATKAGGTVVTLGPIIHNRHVVDRFQRMGVEVANSPEEVRPGSTVVLRAHGVPRQVEETLAGLPVQVVDATCPFVKRIHRLVQEAEAEGRTPVIIATQADGTVDGVVRYRNMLDYRNRDWLMDDTQGRVADSMWLNYWWNWKMIDESVELAESLGLDPFESLFLGVECGYGRFEGSAMYSSSAYPDIGQRP